MSKNAEFADKIRTYFSRGEVEDLCFRLGIDYQDLPGEGKANKVIHLVRYVQQHGRTGELLALTRQLRSHVTWPSLAELQAEPPAPAPTSSESGTNIFVQGDLHLVFAQREAVSIF